MMIIITRIITKNNTKEKKNNNDSEPWLSGYRGIYIDCRARSGQKKWTEWHGSAYSGLGFRGLGHEKDSYAQHQTPDCLACTHVSLNPNPQTHNPTPDCNTAHPPPSMLNAGSGNKQSKPNPNPSSGIILITLQPNRLRIPALFINTVYIHICKKTNITPGLMVLQLPGRQDRVLGSLPLAVGCIPIGPFWDYLIGFFI